MYQEAILKATAEQVSADLQGESVVLHLNSGIYYGLDPVGARVWQLLQTPIAFNDLKNTLLDEFDVDAETCEQHLIELLQQLNDAKLIEVNNAADR